MRLACPNCDAKYEVPDDAIPEAGRDVQCSNCGHTWFQLHPAAEEAAEAEADLYGDDPSPEPEPVFFEPEPEPVPAPAPMAAAPAPVPLSDADLSAALAAALADPEPAPAPPAPPVPPPAAAFFAEDEEDEAPAAPPPAAPPRRELDDAVLNVLREEAEREAEARRAEAQHEAQRAETRRADAEEQMQVQPDLGMDAAPAAGAALTPTQRRLAMLRGEDPDVAPPEPARPAARRDLLPDVEEINSTLQPGDDGADPDAMVDGLPDLTKGSSGFRTGFLLMIFLLIVAAVVYVAAPSLSAAIPALEAPLAAYVVFVDGLRSWLDGMMNQATQALTGEPGG